MRKLYSVNVEITPLSWDFWPVRWTSRYTVKGGQNVVQAARFLCFHVSYTMEEA